MDFASMEAFPGHKFKMYEGQRLDDMVESIRQLGILLPIILWYTDDNRYVILSGHNRVNAGRLAGINKGPVIIKENLTHEGGKFTESAIVQILSGEKTRKPKSDKRKPLKLSLRISPSISPQGRPKNKLRIPLTRRYSTCFLPSPSTGCCHGSMKP